MEDALKRLDRLTQEEARMAAAENLKLTHAVDKRVEGVADRVAGVDEHVAVVADQVAAVDDRVASVNEHVADVVDQVAGVDERIAGVDDRVAGVEECVASVVNQVADVDDRVAGVDDRVQQTANDVDQMKRSSSLNRTSTTDCLTLPILLGNQLRESVHKWLSSPDPSTNHNIACGTHHKKTATWFLEGSLFQEWKSTGPLLWVHGKRLPRPLSDIDFL